MADSAPMSYYCGQEDRMGEVVIGMDPHRRAATIGVMAAHALRQIGMR